MAGTHRNVLYRSEPARCCHVFIPLPGLYTCPTGHQACAQTGLLRDQRLHYHVRVIALRAAALCVDYQVHHGTRMPMLPFRCLTAISAALLFTCTAGCTVNAERQAMQVDAPLHSGKLRDFSGHWEKNYQLSDDLNARIGLFFSDIQRRYASQRQQIQGGPVFGGGAGPSTDAVNGLARFAEELTRTSLIDISHQNGQIDIEREDDFTLRCTYGERQYTRSSNSFGSELCGWTDERLLFRMQLAGGLQIAHQFSLSPDASMLNVTTTVSSDQVVVPLIISNFYTRYEAGGGDYDCILTLTRNTVCSQGRIEQ